MTKYNYNMHHCQYPELRLTHEWVGFTIHRNVTLLQLQAAKWELEALLSDRKMELADLETVTRYVEDLRDLLNESSLVERKAFIRSFVKEVKVTGDEVLLTYLYYPTPSTRGISRESGSSFYCTLWWR